MIRVSLLTTRRPRILLRYTMAMSMTAMSSMGAMSKREGDISNSFVSLSGTEQPPLPDRYRQLKLDRIFGHELKLEESWKRLLRSLREENEGVIIRGSDIIPQVNAAEFENGLSQEVKEEIKKRGVVVVKGVVPEEEARGYKDEVEEYVRRNPHTKGSYDTLFLRG